MATKKKDFTTSQDAVNSIFQQPTEQQNIDISEIQEEKPINQEEESKTKTLKTPIKAKEDKKRTERFGILMDKQLKLDLQHLTNCNDVRSANELIVSILQEYVNQKANQNKLEKYRQLFLNNTKVQK